MVISAPVESRIALLELTCRIVDPYLRTRFQIRLSRRYPAAFGLGVVDIA